MPGSAKRGRRSKAKIMMHIPLPGLPPLLSGPCSDAGMLPPLHIGVDEAGRGCLAGPVVAAAVLFPPEADIRLLLSGMDDSKKLSEARREALAPRIRNEALAFGVGLAWPLEIDGVNILQATFRAMSRAVMRLLASPIVAGIGDVPLVCVDGNHPIGRDAWRICAAVPPSLWHEGVFPEGVRSLGLMDARVSHSADVPERDGKAEVLGAGPCRALPEQRAIIGGDALIPAISAASIVAKTVRDALMRRMEARFPGYGFAVHKGYGTRLHLEALERLGPCPLHRMTFARVKPALG